MIELVVEKSIIRKISSNKTVHTYLSYQKVKMTHWGCQKLLGSARPSSLGKKNITENFKKSKNNLMALRTTVYE